jgi:hypothetical protein
MGGRYSDSSGGRKGDDTSGLLIDLGELARLAKRDDQRARQSKQPSAPLDEDILNLTAFPSEAAPSPPEEPAAPQDEKKGPEALDLAEVRRTERIACLKEVAGGISSYMAHVLDASTLVFNEAPNREGVRLLQAVAAGMVLACQCARFRLLEDKESDEIAEWGKWLDQLRVGLGIKGDIPDELAYVWYLFDRLSPGGEPVWSIINDEEKLRAKYKVLTGETIAVAAVFDTCAGEIEAFSSAPFYRDNHELRPLLQHEGCRRAARMVLAMILGNTSPEKRAQMIMGGLIKTLLSEEKRAK